MPEVQEPVLGPPAWMWKKDRRKAFWMWTQARKLKGQCLGCSKPRGESPSRIHCRSCVDKYNNTRREKYAKVRAEGRCPICLKNDLPSGKGYCNACAARNTFFKTTKQLGISRADFLSWLSAQSPVCHLCGSKDGKWKGRGRLAVDHDHSSGRLRGLLCARCNLMIGMANDDVSVLERAIAYLRSHDVRAAGWGR